MTAVNAATTLCVGTVSQLSAHLKELRRTGVAVYYKIIKLSPQRVL